MTSPSGTTSAGVAAPARTARNRSDGCARPSAVARRTGGGGSRTSISRRPSTPRAARRCSTSSPRPAKGFNPMKLYLTPGACSLADHIALHEAGLTFDRIRVDLQTKRTEDGGDFTELNPKGYVPALVLDDGQLLTENVAILNWVADRAPKLAPGGELGRIRLIEMLAFIATELHKPFVRFFFPTSDAEKQVAEDAIRKRLGFIAARLRGAYLSGDEFS